ncbi:hypothetical protein R1flu_019248 [Riccia fluitans]|uniref:Uncharacterized protein n=1 Tax=Riccia fluitans TaxID=41844 RepID=A0ABD1ZI53_9MARC
MGDREHEFSGIRLRRCSEHVYQDIIPKPSFSIERPAAEKCPPPSNQDIALTPPRLGYLLVNQFLPRASAPPRQKRRSSFPGSIEIRPMQTTTAVHDSKSSHPQVNQTLNQIPSLHTQRNHDHNRVNTSTLVYECGPCSAQVLEISSSPRVEESKSTSPAAIAKRWSCCAGPDPPEVDEPQNAVLTSIEQRNSCHAPHAEERTLPRNLEVSEFRYVDSASIDDNRSSSMLEAEVSPDIDESRNAEPGSINERYGTSQPGDISWSNPVDQVSVDESKSCNMVQEGEISRTIPMAIEVEETVTVRPAYALLEESKCCEIRQEGEISWSNPANVYESVSANPLPVDEGKSFNVSESSDSFESPGESGEEIRVSHAAQGEEKTSFHSDEIQESVDAGRWSHPTGAFSSILPEEEEELESTSTSSRRRYGQDHFVMGYVVRNRKPNRNVPVLSTNSSRDDDELCIGSRFDELDKAAEVVGQMCDKFWPRPGDIVVLQNHRSGIPYPGFDGHVELYVDENYFESPDSTWDWAYEFEDGDILIRFGRFTNNWRWRQGDSVKLYLCYGDCFILVGREVNKELHSLDFRFSDPIARPIHSVQENFQPRVGDLIVRKDPARPFSWNLFWWKGDDYVSKPFDMLVRASFGNSDDRIHCFAVAEVFFRNTKNQHWTFQGRDDYTFGCDL